MYNNLEDSISLTEKTSKKLLPIYLEVLSKIKVIERLKFQNKNEDSDLRNDENNDLESSDIDSKIDIGLSGGDSKKKSKKNLGGQRGGKKEESLLKNKHQVDLRHILGFLNQTEWIQNLNIGNIM